MGAKQISDPVHGIIPLTELEVRIVSSRGFQRLRNVKQLGLAHYVFPGADYSRFSHSLGACHVMGRILDVLTGTEKGEVLREQRQMYRVAALLHDVGHEDPQIPDLLREAGIDPALVESTIRRFRGRTWVRAPAISCTSRPSRRARTDSVSRARD